MIRKYTALGKKVVVIINAPGPMITSTWDAGVAGLLVSWLPGQQNGRGIAMALYNETYGASGRLPFTFPRCRTEACSIEDELASVALGDKIKNKEYLKFSEKALIGYRWYQANNLPVSYPFGYGLFAYGTARMSYNEVVASLEGSVVNIQVTLFQSGPAAGKDVPQLYLSFPSSVPGDAASKPKWVLKGFTKVLVKPNSPVVVNFKLSQRDLSYWDDSPGRSYWICAVGTFKACVGANPLEAAEGRSGACTTFTPACTSGRDSALPIKAVYSLVTEEIPRKEEILSDSNGVVAVAAAPPQYGHFLAALSAALGLAAVAMLAVGLVRLKKQAPHRSYDTLEALVHPRDATEA